MSRRRDTESWVYGKLGSMKTTVELPDELMVEVKVAAARRRCTLREFFEAALRREMVDPAQPAPAKKQRRLKLTTSRGGLAPGFDAANRETMYDWIGRRF
jgi:hypothetical protein